MGYFIDNRKVQFSDLEASGRYSTRVMEEIKKGNYHELKKILDIDTRKDKNFMEPLMYAVKNEKGTYAIYEYYHEKLQNDIELATEIIRTEPELIENTPLSRQKGFILKVVEINPKVIAHMSHDLKEDCEFTGELCKLQNEEVIQYAAIECKMPQVFLENPELTGNEIFMMQAIVQNVNSLKYMSEELKDDYDFMKAISKNIKVIDYVVEHTEQFGKEGLNATKDALVEISTDDAIKGFEEEGKQVKSQITKIQNEESGKELDELLKRDKQLQRHIKFFERIQKGEIDPIRAAKLIDKLCQDLEPDYKQKLYKIIKLDDAIVERNKVENKMDTLNTGLVVDNINPEHYEKAALDFSEGNESLRKLLLVCFNNGIKTRACCAGHDGEKKKQNPYIQFEFNEDNMDAILKMIGQLSQQKGISIDFTKEPGVVSSFQIGFPSEIANECFEMIRQACISQEEIQIEDIEKPMQRAIDIMRNHIIPTSYLQINYDNLGRR